MNSDFLMSVSMLGGFAVVAYVGLWFRAHQFDRKYGKRSFECPSQPRSRAISLGRVPRIAIPVAAFMRPVAMNVGPTRQTRCNDLGHDPPMIAIRSPDDCGSLQVAVRVSNDELPVPALFNTDTIPFVLDRKEKGVLTPGKSVE